MPQPKPPAAPEFDGQNSEPIWQPWALEHRWDESLKYAN
jgi:hypothetical protein